VTEIRFATMTEIAKAPLPVQPQSMPGSSSPTDPPPDYGEATCSGSGCLGGKKLMITGADIGSGRAVALAFARDCAGVLVSYYSEDDDAHETKKRLVEEAGGKWALNDKRVMENGVDTSMRLRKSVAPIRSGWIS
jgi:hypothetical protein